MSLTIKENAGSGKKFETAPAGNHVAICYSLVELGQHYDSENDKWTAKIHIGWELPNEPMADGRPFVVSRRYTASLHEKASLRRDLESWRGRPFTNEELAGFDVKNILGKPCMINVVHNTAKNGNTYANVRSVAAIPKGMTIPDQINPNIAFEFGDQGFDEAAFNALPEWMQSTIMESRDYKVMMDSKPDTAAPFDDEIAF